VLFFFLAPCLFLLPFASLQPKRKVSRSLHNSCKIFESVVVVVVQVIGFFKRIFFWESIDIRGMNWILNPFHCQLLKLHYMSGDNMSSGGGGGFVA
jgi:hypothetical protein